MIIRNTMCSGSFVRRVQQRRELCYDAPPWAAPVSVTLPAANQVRTLCYVAPLVAVLLVLPFVLLCSALQRLGFSAAAAWLSAGNGAMSPYTIRTHAQSARSLFTLTGSLAPLARLPKPPSTAGAPLWSGPADYCLRYGPYVSVYWRDA